MAKATQLVIITTLYIIYFVAAEDSPNDCKCSHREFNCQNASLSEVNFNLLDSTDCELLNLAFNNIVVLQTDFFSEISMIPLKTVFLNDNAINNVNPDVFNTLQYLMHLYLQNNQIDYLHPSVFQVNQNLTILDLSGNKLKSIDPDIFKDNFMLSWVNIERNGLLISSLTPTIFKSSLNLIDAELCETSGSLVNSFQNNEYLKQLNLQQDRTLSLQMFVPSQETEPSKVPDNYFNKLIKNINDHYLRYDHIDEVIFYNSNASLLCFCKGLSVWFWCYEQTSSCESRSNLHSVLKCDGTSSEATGMLLQTTSPLPPPAPSSTVREEFAESDTNMKISLNTTSDVEEGAGNENGSIIYIISASAVVVCIVVFVAAAVAVLYRRRRRGARPNVNFPGDDYNPEYQNPRKNDSLHYGYTEIIQLSNLDPSRDQGNDQNPTPGSPSIGRLQNDDGDNIMPTPTQQRVSYKQAIHSGMPSTSGTDNRPRYGKPMKPPRLDKIRVLPSSSTSETTDKIDLPNSFRKGIAANFRNCEYTPVKSKS